MKFESHQRSDHFLNIRSVGVTTYC